MISSSNKSVYVGDVTIDGEARHLITITEPGRISMWCKSMSGTTLHYSYYDYMGMGGDSGSGAVYPQFAAVVVGTGAQHYNIKHGLSDGGKQVGSSFYSSKSNLPATVPTGDTWKVGDYAMVSSDEYFSMSGQYGIVSIGTGNAITWGWSAPLRGQRLGSVATVSALPTTVPDGGKVGDYYQVTTNTTDTTKNGNHLISAITSGTPTYTQQYTLAMPSVMIDLMDLKDNAFVNCDIFQMTDYISLDFAVALATTEKILVHIVKPTLSIAPVS